MLLDPVMFFKDGGPSMYVVLFLALLSPGPIVVAAVLAGLRFRVPSAAESLRQPSPFGSVVGNTGAGADRG